MATLSVKGLVFQLPAAVFGSQPLTIVDGLLAHRGGFFVTTQRTQRVLQIVC